VHQFARVDALADRQLARLALSLGCFLAVLGSSLGADWVKINSNENLTIYSKDRPGSSVRELRAVGLVNAPSRVILNVLDEVADYPDFMPYTTKAQLIERRPHDAIIYLRWDPPLIGARDGGRNPELHEAYRWPDQLSATLGARYHRRSRSISWRDSNYAR
jgi:hypothetical protein